MGLKSRRNYDKLSGMILLPGLNTIYGKIGIGGQILTGLVQSSGLGRKQDMLLKIFGSDKQDAANQANISDGESAAAMHYPEAGTDEKWLLQLWLPL